MFNFTHLSAAPLSRQAMLQLKVQRVLEVLYQYDTLGMSWVCIAPIRSAAPTLINVIKKQIINVNVNETLT